MITELEKLEKKLKELKEKQAKCDHQWGEPEEEYVEDEIYVPYRVKNHIYSIPSGQYRSIPCISVVCKKCGKKLSKQMVDKTLKIEPLKVID